MRQDELDEVFGIELLEVLKVGMVPALVLIVHTNNSDSCHYAISSSSFQMLRNTVIQSPLASMRQMRSSSAAVFSSSSASSKYRQSRSGFSLAILRRAPLWVSAVRVPRSDRKNQAPEGGKIEQPLPLITSSFILFSSHQIVPQAVKSVAPRSLVFAVHHQLNISLNGVVFHAVIHILDVILGGVRLAEHSDERLLGVLVLNERVDADNVFRLVVVETNIDNSNHIFDPFLTFYIYIILKIIEKIKLKIKRRSD